MYFSVILLQNLVFLNFVSEEGAAKEKKYLRGAKSGRVLEPTTSNQKLLSSLLLVRV